MHESVEEDPNWTGQGQKLKKNASKCQTDTHSDIGNELASYVTERVRIAIQEMPNAPIDLKIQAEQAADFSRSNKASGKEIDLSALTLV